MERWETKAYALLAFLRHPRPVRRYLYTTNQLERLAKEIKRRTKVVEVFCGEGAVEKLLYLVLIIWARHGERADCSGLWKSGWESTMLTGHTKRYTVGFNPLSLLPYRPVFCVF